MVHSEFFITKGKAVSKASQLNAFDSALVEAGIDQCNLVQVSSILPENAKEISLKRITPGTITFCVLSRMDGISGETIASGVAYAFCEGQKGKYGIVAEDHGHKNPDYIKEELKRKLEEMARARNMRLGKIKTVVESIGTIPAQSHGSTMAALVYVPGD